MREKLVPVLEDQASRVNLSTIHSFCHSPVKKRRSDIRDPSWKGTAQFIRQIMKKKRIRNLPTGLVIREIGLSQEQSDIGR
jgi:DNA helicase-2/ATP-dependent DNA helicase PcrA